MLHIVQNKFNLPASWGRAFAVTLFFVTLSAGLFWLDYFRSYSAEATILVIPKPNISLSGSDIAENLAELTRTLSFYDRMLSDNDLIDDAFDGFAPDKRKKFWNDAVTVKRIGRSSVLSLRSVGDTPEKAAILARQTAETLFSVAGLYYNVKTDIDLRIIDGPLVSYTVANPFLYGTASVVTGFFMTALFFLLLNRAPEFVVKGKREVSLDEFLAEHDAVRERYAAPEKSYPEFSPGEAVPWIDPRKFIPAKPATLSFENITPGAKKSVSLGMRAPAPANLPVASSGRELPVMDEAALPASSELERGEPTAEEYKRRLNKLLSGGN